MDVTAFDAAVFRDLQRRLGAARVDKLVTMFNTSAVEILTRMERAAGQADLSAWGNAAHELKSMARTFGLKRIDALADMIEAACLKSDAAVSTHATTQLNECFRHDLSLLIDEQLAVAATASQSPSVPPPPDMSAIKPARPRSSEMLQSFAKLSILLVDDDDFSRAIASSTLRELKVGTIVTAGSGAEALKLIDEPWRYFDLVISDWNMPGMSGLELLTKVRAVGPLTPFIMLTGNASGEFVIRARDHGVNGYIVKPFSAEQLIAKIKGVLRAR